MSCDKYPNRSCIGCRDCEIEMLEECMEKKLSILDKYIKEKAKKDLKKFKETKRINDEIIGKYDILKVWKHEKKTMQNKCPYCDFTITSESMDILTHFEEFYICPNCYTFSKLVRSSDGK